jgi:hypothetical protein
MEVKMFYIVSKGDPSCGVFPSEWALEGGFIFDSEHSLTAFREALTLAFEYVADDVCVETSEERDKRNAEHSE